MRTWLLAISIIAAMLPWAAAPTAQAAEAAMPVPLSEKDRADIARIEDYLNGLKTLRAGFIQVASNGTVAEGKLYLHRPGKIRFEYDPPVPILIVSSGLILYYYDKELDQTTQVFVNATPIGVLTKENLSFSNEITVSHFARDAGTLRLTVQQTDEPDEGAITLVFSDRPLALRKWTVLDAQGTQTTVALNNVETGINLDPGLFKFTVPVDQN